MQAQPRTIAAAGPRLSTATRSQTGDPARAGALRLALLAGMIALVAGAAAFYAARQVLLQGEIARLETVRGAVAANLGEITHGLGDATSLLAGDPRLAAFLRDARDAQRRTTTPRGRSDDAAVARPPKWLAATAQRNGWSDVL